MTAPQTTDVITDTVRRYLDAVATGTAAQIAGLYAPDATVEDPVGSAPHRGTEAVTAFYAALENLRRSTELLALRVAGNEAAFHFRVRTEIDGNAHVIEPIDVMTFDDEGRITSMRAFWSAADMRQA
ncbi:steroid delta-isomerase [Rhodococcus triatomae]|uniref:Steroid delta-isomerase n=1 Tax=Rhodococcus triatomae TaxID=300028 RepID=A0A1G8PLM0_9NOCA|nr:nuclear transport factor 2 family protein [Rhodococcus triatomae]QNG20143.1 steroid delta-isomerase [Rhodococcus triatomae]QNG23941.1 steroid delta-isomerase [Rhodococcus triatomae]SDI93469.1 steroid delta-isomerase [Rhodococcus triatomae]